MQRRQDCCHELLFNFTFEILHWKFWQCHNNVKCKTLNVKCKSWCSVARTIAMRN